MAQEIERKFLVKDNSFLAMAIRVDTITQGYLSVSNPCVRIRLRNQDAYITIKGGSSADGLVRDEWEYSIPYEDAQAMLKECASRTITKRRHLVLYNGRMWEVDVFSDRYEGLVLAEIELECADEVVELPPFLGKEVTGNPIYYNAYMATHRDEYNSQ